MADATVHSASSVDGTRPPCSPLGEVTCFRVHLPERRPGEATLAYDPEVDRWYSW